VNFASAYQQHGAEAHLHAMRQKPGETLRAFICASPRFRAPFLVSSMHLSLLLSDSEYATRGENGSGIPGG